MSQAQAPQFTHADLQQAAPRVLARLRAMADLPPHGTIAGQSVASVFLEELGHPVRGQVNDIDVFVSCGMPRTMRGREPLPADRPYAPRQRVGGTTAHYGDISAESDYQHVKFIALRSSIRILHTYQAGLINYTLIDSPLLRHGHPGNCDEVSQGVVNGFDLNLVGVGINIETGTVVSSPGFLEFLNTSRLRVETCNTPAHTMVRLAKKVFGGEVLGAQCDFDGERKLLEVALACQLANREEQPRPSGFLLYAVQSFGGRYKRLYDRFADVLPGFVSREETLPNQTSYTFYDLTPEAPTHPDDLRLLAAAASHEAFPYAIAQSVHVAQFPRIYELFHPERSLLSPEEIAKRRAAFDRIDPKATDSQNLHWLQLALGRPSVKLEIPGLDEADAAVFFYGQACAANPAMAEHAVAILEDTPPLERWVIHRTEQRADAVLGIGVDRAGGWKRMLADKGVGILDAIYQCPFESEEAHRPALFREIFAWLDEMGPRGQQIFNSLAQRFQHEGERDMRLAAIVKCFPPEERELIGGQLLQKVIPSWPSLEGVDPTAAARALTLCIRMEFDPPASAWDTLPSAAWPVFAEMLCYKLNHLYVQMDAPAQARANGLLYRMLPMLDTDDLQADHGRLLRAVLCVGAGDVLRTHLLQRPDLEALVPTLHAIIKVPARASSADDVFPFADIHNDNKDPWKRPRQPQQVRALLEQILLEHASTPAPAGPRRGFRL